MSDEVYGYDYDEVLTATSIEEFKERVLESNFSKVGESDKEILDRMEADLNFPITCTVFERQKLESVECLAKRIIYDVIENLDENHRIGADDSHDITQPMKDASLAFAKVIHKEYVPWNCDPSGEIVLNRSDFEESE